MTIYPNTTKGIYILQSNLFDFQLKKIIIFDVFGNSVSIIEKPTENQEIDLREMPNGMYHISAVFDRNEAPIRLKLYKE